MNDQPLRLTPAMSSRKLLALGFIKEYFAEHGVGPSFGEIGAALSITSRHAGRLVGSLARARLVHHTPGRARSLVPLDCTADAIRLLRSYGFKVDEDLMRIAQPDVPQSPLMGEAVLDYLPEPEAGSGDDGSDELGRAAG